MAEVPISEEAETVTPAAKPKKPIPQIVIALAVIAAVAYGVKVYHYNSTHVGTDDAYVTNHVVPVSARITGAVAQVLAKENKPVRAGDTLVVLEDATYRADVDQARANLAVAEASVKGASADVSITQETGRAQVVQANEALDVTGSDIATAEVNVDRAMSGVATARASLGTVEAQARAATNTISARAATRHRVQEQLRSLQAIVQSSDAAVASAQSSLEGAKATQSNAQREADRAKALAEEGAISVSLADAKQTQALNARSAVDLAQHQLESARAGAARARADLNAARDQIKEADAAISQARSEAQAAQKAVEAQSARVHESLSEVAAARQGVESARSRKAQAAGKLQEAETAPQKVSVSNANQLIAEAKVKQAKAALENALVALTRTRVKAAVSGVISRKVVEPGQQVSPGQPLMAIIPQELPWIVANLKETQLAHIRPGLPAEVHIDALPGLVLKGHVESISSGTGAVFALLPPENATGNFNKIVQRVPVKIVLDPKQPGIEALRSGLSVSVDIGLGE